MVASERFIPTQESERFESLDILRGFAVLGILVMNIQNFSMISAAYINPTAYGDLSGINYLVWLISHLFADSKFMALFSILFGAGIILFTERIESKGKKATGVYYRRIFWLLLIGLVHGYIFWSGDILFTYALCGFVLFLFRKLKPRTLLILGLLSITVPSVLYLLSGLSIPMWPEASIQETMQTWKPDISFYSAEVEALRGNLAQQLEQRIPRTIWFQTFLFFYLMGWRAGGLMLVGMAQYKWGILTNKRSASFYKKSLAIGMPLGLALISFGVIENFKADWSLEFSMFFGYQYNYWGSLGVAIGYIGLLLLIYKANILKGFSDRLAAVGRMAFSNYLLQTIICTFLFYGHGFGLFGKVERVTQILIVIFILTFQLIISPVWLKHFHFGPAEWLWRSLTYLKVQPFKLTSKVAG